MFHVGNEVSLLGFVVFVLGLACGPIFGSPASETFRIRSNYVIHNPTFWIV